ncbi:MAG: hypothetical protein M3540_06975 [Actinomycetota bacterium]|nr:hypothetical protein [Actinomycetota bacterium]
MATPEPLGTTHDPKRALVIARVALAVAATALLLTAALGIVGYVVLAGRLDELDRQVTQVDDEGTNNSRRIGQAEAQISANAEALEESGKAQVAGLKTQITGLTRRMNTIRDCLPELNNQLNSLSVETTDVNGYLTGAYVTNNLQVSRVCQQVLSPAGRLPGD